MSHNEDLELDDDYFAFPNGILQKKRADEAASVDESEVGNFQLLPRALSPSTPGRSRAESRASSFHDVEEDLPSIESDSLSIYSDAEDFPVEEVNDAKDAGYYKVSDWSHKAKQPLRGIAARESPVEYKRPDHFKSLEDMVDGLLEKCCENATEPNINAATIVNLPIAAARTAWRDITLGTVIVGCLKGALGIVAIPSKVVVGGLSAVTPPSLPENLAKTIDDKWTEIKAASDGKITPKKALKGAFSLQQDLMKGNEAALDLKSKDFLSRCDNAIQILLEDLPEDVKLSSSKVAIVVNAMKHRQWPFMPLVKPNFVLTPEIRAKKDNLLKSYEPLRTVLESVLTQIEQNLSGRGSPKRLQLYCWGRPGTGKSRIGTQLADIYGKWMPSFKIPVDKDTNPRKFLPKFVSLAFDKSDPEKVFGSYLGSRIKAPDGIRIYEESEQYFEPPQPEKETRKKEPEEAGPVAPVETAETAMRNHWNEVKKLHDPSISSLELECGIWLKDQDHGSYGQYEFPANRGLCLFNSNKSLGVANLGEEGEAISGRFTVLCFKALTRGQKVNALNDAFIDFLNGEASDEHKKKACKAFAVAEKPNCLIEDVVTVKGDTPSGKAACEELQKILKLKDISAYKVRRLLLEKDNDNAYAVTPYKENGEPYTEAETKNETKEDEKTIKEYKTSDSEFTFNGSDILAQFSKQLPKIDIAKSQVIEYFLKQDQTRKISDARILLETFRDLLQAVQNKSGEDLMREIDESFRIRWDEPREAQKTPTNTEQQRSISR